jgi:hypothetical protein
MSQTDVAKTLSIGMIVGGRTPGNRAWVEALEQLMRDVIVAREGVDSGIKVNVEFHVPGNFLTPGFEGVRTGVFRKADSLLKVQAAVPPSAPENPRLILLEYMWDAINAVESWAIAKKRSVDTAALRGIVAAVPNADG